MARRKSKSSTFVTFRWFYKTIAYILGITSQPSSNRRILSNKCHRKSHIARLNKPIKISSKHKSLQIDSNRNTKYNDVIRSSQLTSILSNNNNRQYENNEINRSIDDHQQSVLCIRIEDKQTVESIRDLLMRYPSIFKDSRIIDLQEFIQVIQSTMNITYEDASTMTNSEHMYHQLTSCVSFMAQTENVRRLKALEYIRVFIDKDKEEFLNYLMNKEHLCEQKTTAIYQIINQFLVTVYQSEYAQKKHCSID